MVNLLRFRQNYLKTFFRCFSEKSSPIRVRFAPSPTGYLHLGGLRTVAYNYVFAKSQNGKFILRIEDTDRKRLVPDALANLEEMLAWLNFHVDEGPSQGGDYGPYLQSQRLDLYNREVQNLLNKSVAYKCFCSEDRLMLLRNEALKNRQIVKYDNKCRHLTSQQVEEKVKSGLPYVVRFKLEKKSSSFDDLIFGNYEYNFDDDGDFIIMKADGYPTYHFANVVDDRHMKISHVLRGEEWLISTPKHLELYTAFDWKPPIFGHLPLMKGSHGVKLSKREKSAYVEYFKDKGYYPAALINSVSSTGGGFKDRDKHRLYSVDELTEMFDISTITRHGTRFEMDWLNAYNSQVLKATSTKSLVSEMKRFVKNKYGDLVSNLDAEFDVLNDDFVEKVINYGKERISALPQLMEQDLECFWSIPDAEFKLLNDILVLGDGFSVEMLNLSIESLNDDRWTNCRTFDKENISSELHSLAKKYKFNKPKLFKILRAAVNGCFVGPPVAEVFELLGRDLVVKRLKIAVKNVKTNKTDQKNVAKNENLDRKCV